MYAFEQSCECDYDVDWLTTKNNASYCQVKITSKTFGKDLNPYLLKVIMFSHKLVLNRANIFQTNNFRRIVVQ